MLYDFKGRHAKGDRSNIGLEFSGTNIFYQSGTIEGRWFGAITPFGLPRPGQTRVFAIIAAKKDEGDEASTAAFLRAVTNSKLMWSSEDIPVLNTIHFRPGTLTRSDRTLARFSSTCAITRAAIRRRSSSPDREIDLLLFPSRAREHLRLLFASPRCESRHRRKNLPQTALGGVIVESRTTSTWFRRTAIRGLGFPIGAIFAAGDGACRAGDLE